MSDIGMISQDMPAPESERPLSEMTNEEIQAFIEALRERRKNVSLKKSEERAEKKEESLVREKKKNTFGRDDGMNSLLDDILKDL